LLFSSPDDRISERKTAHTFSGNARKGEKQMATMNISLPDQMKEWVEAQTMDGRYANASDFVRDMIRREQVRAEKIAVMQKLVDEGIASGISTLSMDEILEEARARAKTVHAL
jgi:antitoxin ParD1/3/4